MRGAAPPHGLTLLHIALHTEYSVSLGAFLLCALLEKISISNFHKFTCSLITCPHFTDEKLKQSDLSLKSLLILSG